MKWGRLIVLLGIITFWPSTSYAASGFWAWLEELSGPGPFHGWGLSGPVLCTNDGKVVSCRSRSETIRPKRLIFVSFDRLGSNSHPRFKDELDAPDRREVHVVQLSGAYMFRLHPALDAGFGGGTMRFSGADVDPFWRVTLIPVTASVRPLALVKGWEYKWWAYILRSDIETSWVTKGVNAQDFGNSTSDFSSGREFLTRVSVAFDITQLVWR
ncbi:MAG TPA: hypothetical protein VL882_13215 [Vicinamibacterales bacterium]|jgi:hypothetical protein|nr:hypothetical protein [Vicinamibacterales bacterium]